MHTLKCWNKQLQRYLTLGSNGIEPKRDWTNFLKIGFVVTGCGFYSYNNLQCIKIDRERKNVQEKKKVLCIQKTFNAIFKIGFNPVLGSIPCIPWPWSLKALCFIFFCGFKKSVLKKIFYYKLGVQEKSRNKTIYIKKKCRV